MRDRISEYIGLLRLELSTFYHFPVIETVFGVFLFLGITVFLQPLGSDLGISIISGLEWNGNVWIEFYLGHAERTSVSLFALTMIMSGYVLIFLVAMMMSFSFAKSFEDDFIQTCLSYPVSRKMLVIVKASAIILLIGISSTITSTVALYIFVPGPKPLSTILVLILSLWTFTTLVTSTSVLLAVLFKSTAVSTIGGSGLWYSMIPLYIVMVEQFATLPMILRGITNSILFATEFLSERTNAPLLVETVISLFGALSIGILIVLLSMFILDRKDI